MIKIIKNFFTKKYKPENSVNELGLDEVNLIENTKCLINKHESTVYIKFIIPVGNLSKEQAEQAEQQISKLIKDYKEVVKWDDYLGTITINGSSNIPHSKDYWLPSPDSSEISDIHIFHNTKDYWFPQK